MGAWAEWPNLRRVDEATKHQLLDLIDPVVADGWEHRRACNYRARRSRGRVCAGDVDSQSGPRRPRGSQPGPDTRAEPESEDGNDGREHDHGTHQTPPFLLAFNHAGTAHDAPQTHIAGLRGRRSIASASRSDGKGQLQQRLVGLVSDRSMRSLLACDKTRKRPPIPTRHKVPLRELFRCSVATVGHPRARDRHHAGALVAPTRPERVSSVRKRRRVGR